jgi:DNA invertase Pin-like site-specific DNA recombinase
LRTAVVYTRVSSEDQVKGTSLATQAQACRAWCSANAYRVAAEFTDAGESARTAQRPQFLAALEWASRHRPDAFVVLRMDRFARNATDHAVCASRLAGYGTRLVSVQEPTEDDPAGRLLTTLLAGIAQFDNEVRADRAKRAMQDVVKRGGWVWQPPYGYAAARDGRLPILIPHPERGPVVRDLYDGLAAGRRNHAETLRHGASATGLAEQRVHHLLRSPIYAGRIVSRLLPEPVDAAVPGLIAPATWRSVQDVIAGRGFVPRRARDEAYPLRGVVRCATCGGPITGAASRGRSGQRYAYYACRRGCVRMAPDDAHEQLEAYMASEAAAAIPVLRRVARLSAGMVAEAQRDALARQQQAEARQAAILARRARLTDMALAGDVEADEYRHHRAKIDQEVEAAKIAVERATVAQFDTDQAISMALALLQEPARLWRQVDLARRQQLVRVLFGSTLALGKGGFCRTAVSDCNDGVLRITADTAAGVVRPAGVLVEHLRELLPAIADLLAA